MTRTPSHHAGVAGRPIQASDRIPKAAELPDVPLATGIGFASRLLRQRVIANQALAPPLDPDGPADPGIVKVCSAAVVIRQCRHSAGRSLLAPAGVLFELRAASDLQILCSTNLKYRDTVMDFHRASHQCGECRHFHELEVLPGGTCRKEAPQHGPGVIGALVAGKEHPADRYAVKRCPHAHEDDGCGRYEHRCMANDCREPIHSYCERDIVDGQLFCHRHSELKRRRAA